MSLHSGENNGYGMLVIVYSK